MGRFSLPVLHSFQLEYVNGFRVARRAKIESVRAERETVYLNVSMKNRFAMSAEKSVYSSTSSLHDGTHRVCFLYPLKILE